MPVFEAFFSRNRFQLQNLGLIDCIPAKEKAATITIRIKGKGKN